MSRVRPATSGDAAAIGRVVVGICAFGPARQGDLAVGKPVQTGTGELMMINVEPGQWGAGLARELLDKAVAGLRQHGYPEAILWVLDANGRAQRFYEKAGWVKDGAERWDDRAGSLLHELGYRAKP